MAVKDKRFYNRNQGFTGILIHAGGWFSSVGIKNKNFPSGMNFKPPPKVSIRSPHSLGANAGRRT